MSTNDKNEKAQKEEIKQDNEVKGPEERCECEEYKEGWQRARADYLNLQKEVESKKGEWARMSKAQILEDFVPVFDNFKKAFSVEDVGSDQGIKIDNWKKGIEFIMKQFGKIFKDHGVEEIKTVGESFDPNLHEAVGEEEGDEGIIVREVDSGYIMGGRVIKVAKVIVGKLKV